MKTFLFCLSAMFLAIASLPVTGADEAFAQANTRGKQSAPKTPAKKADSNKPAPIKKLSTSCAPCKTLVEQYNKAVDELNKMKLNLAGLDSERRYEQKQLTQTAKNVSKNTKKSSYSNQKYAASAILGRSMEIDAQYKQLEKAYKSQIARLEEILKELAAVIAKCETQCKNDKGKTGLKVAAGDSAATGSGKKKGSDSFALPFDWKGPYQTHCLPCAKLAAKLNELPQMVYERQAKIAVLEATNDRLEDEAYLNSRNGGLSSFSQYQAIANNNQEIKKLKNQIRNIAEYFDKVLKLLRKCEKKYCPAKKDKKVSYLPRDSENESIAISLEDTHSVDGVNAFNTKDVEQVSQTDNSPMPSVTPPPLIERPTPLPPQVAATPTPTPTPPANTPKDEEVPFNPQGGPLSFTARHVMGKSPCPQQIGQTDFTAQGLEEILLHLHSSSGPFNVRYINNPGGKPSAIIEFNCQVPGPGVYMGTINLIAQSTRPQHSFDRKEFNIRASIEVSEGQ